MKKHTTGPWHVECEGAGVHGPRGHTIADLCDEAGNAHCPSKAGNLLANAHLISAAPDLLAAARDIALDMVETAQGSWRAEALLAAIAKAEGRVQPAE